MGWLDSLWMVGRSVHTNFLDNKYEINKRVGDGEERGGGLGLPPKKFLTLPLSSFFSALPCPLQEIAFLCTFFFNHPSHFPFFSQGPTKNLKNVKGEP